jgi:3-oxoacyl-[acyl-carrier protein] reductase
MKRVLITGGTGKIGSEIALHLAEMQFNVSITFHKSKDKAEKLKDDLSRKKLSLTTFYCDLSSVKEIYKLYESFTKKFQILDVLINCAGIFSKDNFPFISEEEFDSYFNLNLKSIYFLIQRFSQIMSENSIIINFSSVGGILPWKSRSLYHVTKSGVISLTRSLALELAPKIRVVSIAPGFIETGKSETEKMPLSKIPLQHYGKIENILQTIDFLITNDYITGITIPIDGGRSLI